MRGITGCGAYLPYRRLDLADVAAFAGAGGRKGRRAVAGFDEDATTMAFEAARTTIRSIPGIEVSSLWYSTTAPPYLDRTNANAVHSALRLRRDAPAYDMVGSMRSAFGALRAASGAAGSALAVASDVRTGRPGGPDEAYFGDGAAAVLVGEGTDDGPVLAEVLAWATTSDEFVDRWRTAGDAYSKVWEERFGEVRYVEAGVDALEAALEQAGITAEQVDRLILTGTHGRAVRAVAGRAGMKVDPLVDQLASSVGVTGCAHPFLLLSAALETAVPGQVIVLAGLADGAEALVLRTTGAVSSFRPLRPVSVQAAGGAPIAYGRYLAWRGVLAVEPPRRPEPARVSSSAAGRSRDWKFGLVGSRSDDGQVSMPPYPGDRERVAMSDVPGTIRTFTIDRLSYTPSPPLVFAVVDFDGGGRLPVELTDVDAAEVEVGGRVEMVFRQLSTADGIHNYFWKARPLREGES